MGEPNCSTFREHTDHIDASNVGYIVDFRRAVIRNQSRLVVWLRGGAGMSYFKNDMMIGCCLGEWFIGYLLDTYGVRGSYLFR